MFVVLFRVHIQLLFQLFIFTVSVICCSVSGQIIEGSDVQKLCASPFLGSDICFQVFYSIIFTYHAY